MRIVFRGLSTLALTLLVAMLPSPAPSAIPLIRNYAIQSGAMEPTLRFRDVVLVNEFAYAFSAPRFGDIALFTAPIPSPNPFIKRVIAVPGDTIRLQDGVLTRNGKGSKGSKEPYLREMPNYRLAVENYGITVDGIALSPQWANIPPRSEWQAPNRVPKGCYLLLGDSRNNSDDSHVWGFAQIGGVFFTGPERGKPAGFSGRALSIIYPTNRIGTL